jgi:2,4-dienoyl-CoA reductase-like NADH-dependent reductase (Old Yellow Enzyme family)
MSIMFDKTAINSMELPSRFVRSATWEGLSTPEGAPVPRLTAMYKVLAKGGVGLIVTGVTYVCPEGRLKQRQLGLHDDALIEPMAAMVDEVHAAGGVLCAQLGHAGSHMWPEAAPEALAPSDFDSPAMPSSGRMVSHSGRAMTAEEIAATVDAFAAAARRAKAAGFDAVQIHAGHGFLLSQFLSPYYNKREDEWGGSNENRARLPRDVVAAVRAEVGPDYPILMKINTFDYIKGGFGPDGLAPALKMLGEAGCDAFELSGGTPDSGKYKASRMGIIRRAYEGYYRHACKFVRQHTDKPLILTGGLRSFEEIEDLVTEGSFDYAGLSRPLIREPNLVKRWREGEDMEPAHCKSENLCFRTTTSEQGLYCLLLEKETQRAAAEKAAKDGEAAS